MSDKPAPYVAPTEEEYKKLQTVKKAGWAMFGVASFFSLCCFISCIIAIIIPIVMRNMNQ